MSSLAVVRASIAPMHADARASSVQISQRLGGHVVSVLTTEGEWLRVRGEDGYDGWMHGGYVDATDADHLTSTDWRLSLGCVVRGERGRWALPLGAWIAAGDSVITGDVLDAVSRPHAFPRQASSIAATAVERFEGTPYQWGGISSWGADCSGLVQTVFWLHGVQLPRDAWQQAEVGRDAGVEPARWQPADLVFFSERADQRITHVGIALGDARMVHLALGRGGYAVESLDATDDAYVNALMTRFVAARRPL